MIDPNALNQLLGLYDQNGMGNRSGGGFGFVGGGFSLDPNAGSARLNWALHQMNNNGGGMDMGAHTMPDYFGSMGPAYVPPQQFNPQMPARQPVSAPIPNYLATLLRR